MRASLALLNIEARRNLGLWAFPFLAMLIGYTTAETLPRGVWLWPHTSVAVQDTLVVAGPLVAGLAAWVAGGNRRRSVEELLTTTSLPAAVRDLMPWVATVAWVCLGYAVSTIIMLFLTFLGASWGTPAFGPLLAGMLALCMHSAIGYMVGHFLPRLFTAPLVAVAAYVLQGIAGFNLGSYLSPVATPFPDAFYGIFPNVSILQALWFLSSTAVALGLVALRRRGETRIIWFATVGAATAAASVALVLANTSTPMTPAEAQKSVVPYQPTCVKEPLRGDHTAACRAFRGLLFSVQSALGECVVVFFRRRKDV